MRWKARLHIRTFWVVWCRELNANWFFFSSKVPIYRKKSSSIGVFTDQRLLLGLAWAFLHRLALLFFLLLDVSAGDRHQPDIWQNALHLWNDGFKNKKKRFDSSELIVSTSYPHSRASPTGVSHPRCLASCSLEEEGFCVWLLCRVKTSSYLRFPPRPSRWLCRCNLNTAAKRGLCPFG